MIEIIGLISPFFGLIALGYAVGRAAEVPAEGLAWFNIFILYVALPALLFNLVSQTPVEELPRPDFIALTTLATFIVFCLGAGTALMKRTKLAEATIQGLGAAYGNIGYMGPGLALVVLGPEAAVPVALIFSFDNTLHFVMTPSLMAMSGERRMSYPKLAFEVLKRIFGHPFIIATIVGVLAAFSPYKLPSPAQDTVDLLAGAAAPCALFAMGVTLALRPLKRVPREIGVLVSLKLFIHPLLVWGLLGLAGTFDPVWVQAAILMASLPTATNVFVIAQQYGVWVERASATILISTILSVITVAAILYAFQAGILPTDPFAG